MKVAICGLLSSENLGEWFIADSLKYLVKETYLSNNTNQDIDFVYVDILANKDKIKSVQNPIKRRITNYYGYHLYGLPMEVIDAFLKKIAKKTNNNIIHKIRHYIWTHSCNFKHRFDKYYSQKFKNVDLIIIDGAGLLEYSANEYHEPLYCISKYAERYDIPVVYNAIGSSGKIDFNDYRCKILMNAMQSPMVKYISARDSQEIVQICASNKHNVKLLADAAFWCSEAYNVKKCENSNMIGIGLIRGNALERYGVNFGEEDWLNLFQNIAIELDKQGYEYFFFTNGMPADYEIGKKLLKRMNLSKSKLVDIPQNADELIKTIASTKGIIACRMHASIAATSLGIPSIVLSWNDKIIKYMNNLEYPDRAITIENFNAKYIVNSFEKAISEGICKENINKMKSLAKCSVQGYKNLLISTNI